MDRRSFCRLLGTAALAAAVPGGAAAQGKVRDMLGREVTLARQPERIVLLDARDIVAMALLHPDPAARVVGWAAVDMLDSDHLRDQYSKRPDGITIDVVGSRSADTVSVEKILALEPDLVVATAFMAPDLEQSALVAQLASAGVPVVFSNAASNAASRISRDPFADLGQMMTMWGGILGRGSQASDYLAFVRGKLEKVRAGLAGAPAVKTYLEIMSTADDCCWSAGTHLWGDLLGLAGGRNLEAVTAPWYAKVGVEQLIAEAPQVYIASGGQFAASGRPAIGPGLEGGREQEGLRQLIARSGFEGLPAVRDRRVHAFWTGLIAIAPLNVLFVEAAARWLHPDLTRDLDPAGSLAEINARFLAKPLSGPCWASLRF